MAADRPVDLLGLNTTHKTVTPPITGEPMPDPKQVPWYNANNNRLPTPLAQFVTTPGMGYSQDVIDGSIDFDDQAFDDEVGLRTLVRYAKTVRRISDRYCQDIKQDYPDGSHRAQAAKQIQRIKDIFDLLIDFLENKEGMQLSIDVVRGIRLGIKKYAEYFGPLIVTFSIAALLCQFKGCQHFQRYRRFAKQLQNIDDSLSQAQDNIGSVSDMLEDAGKALRSAVKGKASANMRTFLEDKFEEINVEFKISHTFLEAAERQAHELQRDLENYRNEKLTEGSFILGGATVVGVFLNYKNILDNVGTACMIASSSIPLVYTYTWLSLDIYDMLDKLKERQTSREQLILQLKALDLRHQRLVQKHNDTMKPRPDIFSKSM